MRLGLVGCVKKKRPTKALAKDLYVSPLFRGQRRYVERHCDDWIVLSAKHGVLEPDEEVEPYDVTLTNMSRAERRAWAVDVLRQLIPRLNQGDVVEMHAGANYVDFGLEAGLEERGILVERPTRGLSQGYQLRFYSRES